MKNYIKMISNIFLYIIIYFSCRLLTLFTYSYYYAAKNINKFPPYQLQKKIQLLINSNIFIFTTVAALLSLVIYILIFKSMENNLIERCQFKKINFKNFFLNSLIAISLSIFTCSLTLFFENNINNFMQTAPELSTNIDSIWGILSIVIIIPIFKEILFLGLIFNELKKYMNIIFSIIIQGLIFAFPYINILQIFCSIVLAIILALVYIRTKSILSPIILHIFYNLFIVFILPWLIIPLLKFSIVFIFVSSIICLISLYGLYKINGDKNIYKASTLDRTI